MSLTEKSAREFIGYEYMELNVNTEQVSRYMDCYENFGWFRDDNAPSANGLHQTTVKMKRDRKIMNKMELTRLQRNFEACVFEIEKLEKSKTSLAFKYAIVIGILGTVFMAASTFAVTAEPPQILLCSIFAIPGFIGWGFPYFIYKKMVSKQTEKMTPIIEEKYDEIYVICEKGNKLLN